MRYYKPGSNEKVSLFTPLPLEWMATKATTEQTGFDTAGAGLAAEGEALSVKSLMSQDKTRQELLATYHGKINKVMDNLQATGNWKGIEPIVTRLKQSWEADPTRKTLEYNLAQKTLHDKDIMELKKGQKYKDYNDIEDLTWKAYNDDGSLNVYNYNGVEASGDHTKGAQDVMGTISKDGKTIDVEAPYDNLGAYVTTKNGWTGVTSDKLSNLSAIKAIDYIEGNPDGQDWTRWYKAYNPDWNDPVYGDEVDEKGNKTGKQVQIGTNLTVAATEKLYSSNAQQVGLITESGQGYQDYSEGHLKKVDKKGPRPEGPVGTTQIEGAGFDKLFESSKSAFTSSETSLYGAAKSGDAIPTWAETGKGVFNITNLDENKYNTIKNYAEDAGLNTTVLDAAREYGSFDNILKAYKQGKISSLPSGMTDDQIKNAITPFVTSANKLVDNINNSLKSQVIGSPPTDNEVADFKLNVTGNETSPIITAGQAAGALAKNSVLTADGTPFVTLQEAFDDNNINPDADVIYTSSITNSDNKLYTVAKAGGVSTTHFASGYVLSAKDKNGDYKTFYVSDFDHYTGEGSAEKNNELAMKRTATYVANSAEVTSNVNPSGYVNMQTIINNGVKRNDLTMNDLYYNPTTGKYIDFGNIYLKKDITNNKWIVNGDKNYYNSVDEIIKTYTP